MARKPTMKKSAAARKKPARKKAEPVTPGLRGALGRLKQRPRRVLYWLAVAGVWAVIFVFFLAGWFAHDLPDLDRLEAPEAARALEVRAADGSVLAKYGARSGAWITFDAIPPALPLALVAIEDRRFFTHGGFDLRSFMRAVVANISAGRMKQGGSTLTQQLAKNLFLTRERKLKRKLQELLLAFWIEKKFTKAQILELYLNRVYFGGGAYGIDSASRVFFGHPATTLSLEESAMLAGLVQAPSRFAPTRSLDAAMKRQAIVLGAMVDQGLVSADRAAIAKANPPRIEKGAAGGPVRYFTDWVRERALARVPQGTAPIVIHTTLDINAQSTLAAAIGDEIRRNGKTLKVSQGAGVILALDGSVKAMVGGADYARSQYNRITQARRQPGSAFKTFVYLAGIESGYDRRSRFVDEAVTIDDWSPRNYKREFLGEMTLGDAFTRSINTVAVKLSEDVGRRRVADMATRLGIRDPVRAHPSVALGTSEVQLLDLTAAYGAIASGGYRITPYAIIEIRTTGGQLLWRQDPVDFTRVLARDTVREMTAFMHAVVTDGTGRAANPGRPAAGKTGTTQEWRDALFAGFTADLVGTVWFGNDNATPMARVSGGGLPARTWARAMKGAHEGLPVRALLSDDVARTSLEASVKEDTRSWLDRIFD